jgi:CO/xanthine dehydrogenase Mo-binding subunit
MKKRGLGIAAACYPTGVAGGGDLSQALVKVQPDGTVDLIIGAVDVGQGSTTVLAQMAAEELGIRYEQVHVVNQDTDANPISFGTFASRVTFFDGNAVVAAAKEAKSILFELAAKDLKASPENLEVMEGMIFIREDPENSVSMADVARKAIFGSGKPIVGQGYYTRPQSRPDPETGSVNSFSTMAWAATMAEVEVDTETGEVKVLKLVSSYDIGKAINPLLVEGQIEGGIVMGIGDALMEHLYPYYPSLEWQPETFGDYVIPTAVDVPELEQEVLECPSTNGPYGAKGFGEMTANLPSPAIVNAIYDAVGVWIDDLPATPERVLRALEKKG